MDGLKTTEKLVVGKAAMLCWSTMWQTLARGALIN